METKQMSTNDVRRFLRFMVDRSKRKNTKKHAAQITVGDKADVTERN